MCAALAAAAASVSTTATASAHAQHRQRTGAGADAGADTDAGAATATDDSAGDDTTVATPTAAATLATDGGDGVQSGPHRGPLSRPTAHVSGRCWRGRLPSAAAQDPTEGLLCHADLHQPQPAQEGNRLTGVHLHSLRRVA
jgi:hypothetical protein